MKAITVFGETNRSAKLIEALGYDRPTEWDEADEEEGEEEGGEQAEDDDEEEEGGSDSGEHSGDRSDGETSIAATEQFECDEDDGEEGEAGAGGGGEGQQQGLVKKSRMATYTLVDIPPALQRELDEFVRWRTLTVNSERNGVCVEVVTAAGNKSDALRLLGWLKAERNVAPSLCGVFGSDRLGPAVQQFIAHLRSRGRTYTTCAGYAKSFAIVARFVHAARTARAPKGTVVSSTPVDAMHGLLAQTKQQGRLEEKFSGKPTAWLDWAQVQTARARAVRLYESAAQEGEAPGTLHKRLFDATLLTWLTSVPPDRVGVSRLLRLGDTLKPTATGFDLDLSRPGQHKTSAAFGPTITAVPAPTAKLLTAWLGATGRTGSTAQPHVFVPGADASKPLGAPQWTKLVKAVFKAHAGVPLAPKELRSSFITFLRSGHNSDAALKSAAFAMRHSSAQARGPAYDKERAERLSAAAVQVATDFAAGFK